MAIGLGLGIWALVDTVVEPLAGGISDRLGRLPVAVPGLVVTLGGLYLLSRANNTASAYIAIAILSVGWAIVHAIADSVSQDALPPSLRGMGAAVLYLCFDLSVGINAQLLGGLIDGRDFSAYFSAAAGGVLVFGVIGLLLTNRLVSYEQRAAILTAGD